MHVTLNTREAVAILFMISSYAKAVYIYNNVFVILEIMYSI